ncbi:hypothetical protein BJ508DRAFT_307698 [Ascobolus immersus RN42]|uniref:Uncharacterized protein n=1 Tax=Ascobolus immersus RN42 TaxID=1160509 RepID=A0A3N4I215_ASCIM|nr:hypothetical protein BJ508DRAFT_307698 [Ascobolus immersus RN42]
MYELGQEPHCKLSTYLVPEIISRVATPTDGLGLMGRLVMENPPETVDDFYEDAVRLWERCLPVDKFSFKVFKDRFSIPDPVHLKTQKGVIRCSASAIVAIIGIRFRTTMPNEPTESPSFARWHRTMARCMGYMLLRIAGSPRKAPKMVCVMVYELLVDPEMEWGAFEKERVFWGGCTKPPKISSRTLLIEGRKEDTSVLRRDLLLEDGRAPRLDPKRVDELVEVLGQIESEDELYLSAQWMQAYALSNPEYTLFQPEEHLLASTFPIPQARDFVLPFTSSTQSLGQCAELIPMINIFTDVEPEGTSRPARRGHITTLSLPPVESPDESPDFRRMCCTCEGTMIPNAAHHNCSYRDAARTRV